MIKRVLSAARKFTAADYALFKIYMVSIGVLLGIYFWQWLSCYLYIIWNIAIATGCITLGRLIFLDCTKEQ